MVAFALGSVIVGVTLILHVLVWRLRPVARTVGRLIALYPVAVLICVALVATGVLPGPGSWAEAARALLMSVAVFLVHLSFFTAVEKDSASSVILLAAAREGGASRESLYRALDDEDMIIERLRGLVRGGFLREEAGRYGLTRRGRWFLGAVRTARRLFTADGIGG